MNPQQARPTIRIETHEGVRGIDPDAWNHLVGDGSPFLDHGFLSLLEETGCTGHDAGWLPMILTATRVPEGAPEDAPGERCPSTSRRTRPGSSSSTGVGPTRRTAPASATTPRLSWPCPSRP